jgi:hypothetical protein
MSELISTNIKRESVETLSVRYEIVCNKPGDPICAWVWEATDASGTNIIESLPLAERERLDEACWLEWQKTKFAEKWGV